MANNPKTVCNPSIEVILVNITSGEPIPDATPAPDTDIQSKQILNTFSILYMTSNVKLHTQIQVFLHRVFLYRIAALG